MAWKSARTDSETWQLTKVLPSAAMHSEEVLFLVLHYLSGILPDGAPLLQQLEAACQQHGALLPQRIDYQGHRHPCSLSQLQASYSHLPQDALQRMLQCLLQVRQQDGQVGSQGLTTLLGDGCLSLLIPPPRLKLPSSDTAQQQQQPQQVAEAFQKQQQQQQQQRRVLEWLYAPYSAAKLLQGALLQQLHGRRAKAPLDTPAHTATQLRHAMTRRGHRLAVYCVTFARHGQLLVTGSDDWLVKVWSTTTGRLLKTCRGHTGEITDVQVHEQQHLFASSANDGIIRVWSIQAGSLGYPLAVLRGHEGPVTSILFHPVQAAPILLSTSDDGTCRIWNAQDDTISPLVLTSGPQFIVPRTTDEIITSQAGQTLQQLDAHHPLNLTAPIGVDGLGQPQLPQETHLEGTSSRQARNQGTTTQHARGVASAAQTTRSRVRGATPPVTQPSNATAAAAVTVSALTPGRTGTPDLTAAATAAAAAEVAGQDQDADDNAAIGPLNACGVSPDGQCIFASGKDGYVYIWHWPVPAIHVPGDIAVVVQQPVEPIEPIKQQQNQGEAAPHSIGQQQVGSLDEKVLLKPAVSLGPPTAAARASEQQEALKAGNEVDAHVAGTSSGLKKIRIKVGRAAVRAVQNGHRSAAGYPILPALGSSVGAHTSITHTSSNGMHTTGVELSTSAPSRSDDLTAGFKSIDAAEGKDNEFGWEKIARGQWPAAKEFTKLVGHNGEVTKLLLSSTGRAFATIAKDGQIRVWWQHHQQGTWLGAWNEPLVLSCLIEEAELALAKQKRRPPAAPHINNFACNADDSKVLGLCSDCALRVWNATTGALMHTIRNAHTEQGYVIDAHPYDPRIAFTAGLDGLVIVWDVCQGQALRTFSTQDTIPLTGARWTDPLPVMEGAWMQDGAGFVVCDASGQLHMYTTRVPDLACKRWPYDQFFSLDYSALTHDTQGWVIDTERQMPPHLIINQQLVDRTEEVYGPEYQEACRTGCSSHIAIPPSNQLPQGLVAWPPTITAATWQTAVRTSSAAALQAAAMRAMQRHRDALEAYLLQQSAHEAGHRNQPAGTLTDPQDHTQAYLQAVAAADVNDAEGRQAGLEEASPSSGTTSPSAHLSEEEEEEEEEEEQDSDVSFAGDTDSDSSNGGDDSARRRSNRRRPRAVQQASARGVSLRPRNRIRRSRRYEEEWDGEGEGDEGGEQEQEDEPRRLRHSQRLGTKRARGLYRELSSGGEGSEHSSDADSSDSMHSGRQRQRRRLRQSSEGPVGSRRGLRQRQRLETQTVVRPVTDSGDDGHEGEGRQEAGGEGASHGDGVMRQRRARRGGSPSAGEGAEDQRAGSRHRADRSGRPRHSTRHRASAWEQTGRPIDQYEWLRGVQAMPGYFVPQAGDEVVYLRHGHHIYLESIRDRRTPRPWQSLEQAFAADMSARQHLAPQQQLAQQPAQECNVTGLQDAGQANWTMKPAEPCRVISISYAIARGGITVPRLHLQLLEPPAGLTTPHFDLELPSPHAGHAEFLLLCSRYETSASTPWQLGSMCKTFQMDDQGGQWWNAVVVEDRQLHTTPRIHATQSTQPLQPMQPSQPIQAPPPPPQPQPPPVPANQQHDAALQQQAAASQEHGAAPQQHEAASQQHDAGPQVQDPLIAALQAALLPHNIDLTQFAAPLPNQPPLLPPLAPALEPQPHQDAVQVEEQHSRGRQARQARRRQSDMVSEQQPQHFSVMHEEEQHERGRRTRQARRRTSDEGQDSDDGTAAAARRQLRASTRLRPRTRSHWAADSDDEDDEHVRHQPLRASSRLAHRRSTRHQQQDDMFVDFDTDSEEAQQRPVRTSTRLATRTQHNPRYTPQDFETDQLHGMYDHAQEVGLEKAEAGPASMLAQQHEQQPEAAAPLQFLGDWERYGVCWCSTLTPEGPQGPAEDYLSPWEMYPVDSSWEAVLLADPHLTPAFTQAAVQAVQAVLPGGHSYEEDFQWFEAAPAPDDMFVSQHWGGGSPVMYNAYIPLPLGLRDVLARLEAGYYRQQQALLGDLDIIANNAGMFNGHESSVYASACRLRDTLHTMLGQLLSAEQQPPTAAQPPNDLQQQQQQQQQQQHLEPPVTVSASMGE